MKRTLSHLLLAIAGSTALISTANARTDVGVSVSVNQPGVYGRIDIGNQPPPAVIYAEPVIIAPRPAYQVRPIYMHVPHGHHKNWRRYCGRYQACNQPVYFVRGNDARWEGRRGHDHDRYEDDRRDHHGHGHGHGRGHGHGHH